MTLPPFHISKSFSLSHTHTHSLLNRKHTHAVPNGANHEGIEDTEDAASTSWFLIDGTAEQSFEDASQEGLPCSGWKGEHQAKDRNPK